MSDERGLARHSPFVQVKPSSQKASTGVDFSGSSWEFPTLEWSTPLRNSSTQRQLVMC